MKKRGSLGIRRKEPYLGGAQSKRAIAFQGQEKALESGGDAGNAIAPPLERLDLVVEAFHQTTIAPHIPCVSTQLYPLDMGDTRRNPKEPEEIMQTFGVNTWEKVLAFFAEGAGGRLENRWGWLEVLRKAENGDLVLGIPWNVESARDTLGVYKIRGDSEGKISVGDFDHAYFANHQSRYTLASERRILPFNTRDSKIHRHMSFEIFQYSKDDAIAVGLDVLSIAAERGGSLEIQAVFNAIGEWGSIEGIKRVVRPKRFGADISSEHILSIYGTVPGVGIAADVVDVVAHALGMRVNYSP